MHTHCKDVSSHGESAVMARPETEHDGTRLDRALAGHGLNRSKLAKKWGVAGSTVQKWYDALRDGTITDSMWHSCASALQKVGIDPSEVRPGASVPTRTRAAGLIDPIMSVDSPAVLTLLREVLDLESEDDRETVRKLVNAKLKKL